MTTRAEGRLARCSFYREKCAEGDAAQRTRQVYEEALKILGLHPGGGDGDMNGGGMGENAWKSCKYSNGVYLRVYIYIYLQ